MSPKSTQARLDQILPMIQDPRFRESRGLSNEIPFFVFDYPYKDEILVRDHVAFLMKKMKNHDSPIHAVQIDLYDLILELLKERNILDRIPADEEKLGFAEVMKRLKPILKPENFIQEIKQQIPEGTTFVLMTGVGNAYPLLRSHTVLNNLHHVLKDIPLTAR